MGRIGELLYRTAPRLCSDLHFESSIERVAYYQKNLFKISAPKRGTAERWVKEGKNATNRISLSCHEFQNNAVRLQLFALAYNLANFLRRLGLPRSVKQWSLTTIRDKLIKIGAKVVEHVRYVIFQLAEVAVPRQLFEEILVKIKATRAAPT